MYIYSNNTKRKFSLFPNYLICSYLFFNVPEILISTTQTNKKEKETRFNIIMYFITGYR